MTSDGIRWLTASANTAWSNGQRSEVETTQLGRHSEYKRLNPWRTAKKMANSLIIQAQRRRTLSWNCGAPLEKWAQRTLCSLRAQASAARRSAKVVAPINSRMPTQHCA